MDSEMMARQYKLNKWTEIIRECRSSGLTIANWCKVNSVTPSNYYYWLKRVRQAACDSLPSIDQKVCNIIPIALENPITANVIEQDYSTSLRIVVSDFTLEFSNNASASLIENTLKVINNVR